MMKLENKSDVLVPEFCEFPFIQSSDGIIFKIDFSFICKIKRSNDMKQS